MNYRQACLKRDIEQIIIAPLIFIGKILGHLFPLKKKSNLFLFFSSDVAGGATKVNIDIMELMLARKPVVIFSKNYKNNAFAHYFDRPDVSVIDLRKKIDHKALHFVNIIYRGILSVWINSAEQPVVFGGETLYFYKVLPYLKKKVRVIELSHLNSWLNYNQAFIKYIDTRIASTAKLKRDIETQYHKNEVPGAFLTRLTFIDNWVDIPECPTVHKKSDDLNVLFVGRGAPQKRVHLVSQIAEKVIKGSGNIHFSFVGDVENLVSEFVHVHAAVYGNIGDKEKLYSLYDAADILILTSAYEGLPIVVMDMMARGKVVLSTAVDGIPDYIHHHKTGLLICETDEQKIVDEGVRLIYEMDKDRAGLQEIGKNAYLFAKEHFAKALFDKQYTMIFSAPDK